MKPRYVSAFAFLLLAVVALADAGKQKSPSATQPAMSKQTRMDLIRTFNAELVYIRNPFPMGKKGLTLKDGKVSPDAQELQQLIAMWGPAVKSGDRAMITAVVIKDDHIHFEINGGPVRKKKWYQHVTISGNAGAVPMAPSDSDANPRGSYLDLMFDHYVPELNPQQLKDLLRPVFDFDSKSPLEAYLDTVPPKVKEAIKSHQVLVGMNRDMVIYAKGRPPTKDREKDGDVEYEEWIYGQPPEDVEFVRFVGDEVVRVETMKVGGEKVVRTEKEVDIESQPKVAKGEEPRPRPANAPSLRRPGEPVDTSVPTTVPSSTPVPPVASPPSQNPPSAPTPDAGTGQIPH